MSSTSPTCPREPWSSARRFFHVGISIWLEQPSWAQEADGQPRRTPDMPQATPVVDPGRRDYRGGRPARSGVDATARQQTPAP